MNSNHVRVVIPETHYTLLDLSRGGMPEVLVVNDALVGFAHEPIFPWHLCITLEAKHLVDNGMPSPDENALLFDIGDEIEAAVLGGRTRHGGVNALFLARSTCDGLRELLFQVHDPEISHGALQSLLDGRDWPRPWEYRMECDSGWSEATNVLQVLIGATSKEAEGDSD
jgi:hypothetical protein